MSDFSLIILFVHYLLLHSLLDYINVFIFCNDILYEDTDGLREQSLEGARMGFTGKQVIHPVQVPIVQTAFSPNPQKVEWATELIKGFEEHQSSGKVCFVRFRVHSN